MPPKIKINKGKGGAGKPEIGINAGKSAASAAPATKFKAHLRRQRKARPSGVPDAQDVRKAELSLEHLKQCTTKGRGDGYGFELGFKLAVTANNMGISAMCPKTTKVDTNEVELIPLPQMFTCSVLPLNKGLDSAIAADVSSQLFACTTLYVNNRAAIKYNMLDSKQRPLTLISNGLLTAQAGYYWHSPPNKVTR